MYDTTTGTGHDDASNPAGHHRPDPIVTAAARPYGVRVTHTGSSTVTTEWFDTLWHRSEWMATAPNVTVELRPLVRVTDHDEHGTFLAGREVISLHTLTEAACQEAWHAAQRHAALRHQLAAIELRAVWPTATVIVADLESALAGNGNPFIEEVRDATGAAVWTDENRWNGADAVDRAAEQLAKALDDTDATTVGWQPLTAAQLTEWVGTAPLFGEYYSLTLPVRLPLPNAGRR